MGRDIHGHLSGMIPDPSTDNSRLTSPEREHLAVTAGYSYVDAIDPKDGQRYRYTGRMGFTPEDIKQGRLVPRFLLDKVLASGPAPRYGITYNDISTPEDRAVWIAGSSLKVIDLETKEVIAERIGYLFDRGCIDLTHS